MVVNYGSWLVKPYFTNNPNGPCSHVQNNPQSPNHFMDAKDDEKLSSSKSLWIRLTGIYLIVLTVTICITGTIVYLFVLPKVPLDTCNCSTNTKGIFARIEELERKLNLFEKSLPAFLEFEAQSFPNSQTNPKVLNDRSKRSADNRYKRQIERQLIQDGVPIVLNEGNLGENGTVSSDSRKNTEGLRIYDSWYQNANSIPPSMRNGRNVQGRSNVNDPIRPHHRKSASWVEHNGKRRKRKKHNLNAHFDENSIYRNAYPRGRPGRSRAIDLPTKNRAKQTSRPVQELISARRSRVSITATESSYPVPDKNDDMARKAKNNRAAVRSLENRNQRQRHHGGRRRNHQGHGRQLGIHHQVSSSASSSSSSISNALPLVESVVLNERKPKVRSGGSQSSGGAIKDQFNGLKSVHFVGKLDRPPVDGNYRNLEEDGKFKNWRVARWAKKMRLEEEFPLNNGSAKIKQPGVYYIYAQINYLDEHDVNAFQVLVNEDPFLLCTVMTHTGRSHTISKANTCYTGGVMFLEADDEICIRDLEIGRHSVVRPAHTFFGLIQLSGLNV